MFTHSDTFDGNVGASIQDHVPQLGGRWTAVNATPPAAVTIDSRGGCSTTTAGNNDYEQANPLAPNSFLLAIKFTSATSSSTQSFTIIAAPSPAYASFVLLSYDAPSSTLQLATSGHNVNLSISFNDGLPHEIGILYEQDASGNPIAYMVVDGSPGLNITAGLPTGTLFPFLRMTGGAGGTTATLVQQVYATDTNEVPLLATGFVCPAIGVYVQWTPATGSSQSALRFEFPSRAIVLKGPFADQAVSWVMQQTPPDLTFAS